LSHAPSPKGIYIHFDILSTLSPLKIIIEFRTRQTLYYYCYYQFWINVVNYLWRGLNFSIEI
jgi:hypothetical protein